MYFFGNGERNKLYYNYLGLTQQHQRRTKFDFELHGLRKRKRELG